MVNVELQLKRSQFLAGHFYSGNKRLEYKKVASVNNNA